MSEKQRLLKQLRLLSSGTVAGFIGNPKYSAIDAAINKTILFVTRVLTEEDCKIVVTLKDICDLMYVATRAPELFNSPDAMTPEAFAETLT